MIILLAFIDKKIYNICVSTHILYLGGFMKNIDKDELLLRMSEFYKTLSDFTRFKIVYALLDKEMNVNEIEKEVNMSQTAVSYQLKSLRQSRLVKYERRGQNVYYSIDDEHISKIINITLEHVKETL